MGREEQIEEREVLNSIFPDEIKDIDERSYTITISLDPPTDSLPSEPEPPIMLLTVRYPEAYPDVGPDLSLSNSLDSSNESQPYFNLSEDKEQLLSSLESTIEENLGMAMVFALVSTLKENAEELIAGRKAVTAKAREEALLEAERQENAKFHGQAVTRESFLAWRAQFMDEMEKKRLREEEERAVEMKKKKCEGTCEDNRTAAVGERPRWQGRYR